MTKRVHELGRRWDVRVPRADIRWLMGRVHVATSDDEVAADIRRRCTAPGFTEALIRQSIAYALLLPHQHRALCKQFRL